MATLNVPDVEVIGSKKSQFLNLRKDIDILDTILGICGKIYSKTYVFPIGTYLRLIPSEVKRCNLKYCAWDLLPENCLEDVRVGKACIVFDTILEALFLPGHDIGEELSIIYSEICRLNLDPTALYIPTSNLSATKVHSKFIESRVDFQRSINIICANFLILYCLEEHQRSTTLLSLYKSMKDNKAVFWENWIKRKTQKFIFSLNRKAKEHRMVNLYFLARSLSRIDPRADLHRRP